MIQFQENAWTEGRMEGQKDGQTLFYRTFPATPGVQKLTRMKTNIQMDTKAKKKKLKTNTVSCQCWSPR